jgi:hypothetical protein
MTDDDSELNDLLARQAEEVRQYVERARAADAQKLASLVRQMIAAMGLNMDDVIAALGLSGTAANVSTASGSVALPKLGMVGFGDVGTGTDSLAVAELGIVAADDLGELTKSAVRDGLAGRSYSQIYILALIVVIATTLGVILPDLTIRNMAELVGEVAIFEAARGLAKDAIRKR